VTLTVPTNGSSASFSAAGKFGSASSANGDVSVEARSGTTLVGSLPVMIRVRKNANTLSVGERERFISALAQLNNQGRADIKIFAICIRNPLNQPHGFPGFLPWHRAYILDLERDLQAIDPSVTLPYWRFDEAAPKIFALEFLGKSDSIGTVQFSPSNPLRFWKTDGQSGINRRPLFPIDTAPSGLLNEAQTMNLGPTFGKFRGMKATLMDSHTLVSVAGSNPQPPHQRTPVLLTSLEPAPPACALSYLTETTLPATPAPYAPQKARFGASWHLSFTVKTSPVRML